MCLRVFKGQVLLPFQWHKMLLEFTHDNIPAEVIKELRRGDALLDPTLKKKGKNLPGVWRLRAALATAILRC